MTIDRPALVLGNGLGRIRGCRARVCDRTRRRSGDAAAVGQRHRQSRRSGPWYRRQARRTRWAGNSRENRLTPFANDPVSDPTGEALFLRDDDSGRRLVAHAGAGTAYPGQRPLPDSAPRRRVPLRRMRHMASSRNSLYSWMLARPVKFTLLTLTNRSARHRRLSAFSYSEWRLGPPRSGEHLHVVTERDQESGAILASNAYNQEFAIARRLCRIQRDAAFRRRPTASPFSGAMVRCHAPPP